MRYVLATLICSVSLSANARHFECEATASSNNTSYTLSVFPDRIQACVGGNSCIDYKVQNCNVRSVEGPHNKVQLEGSCEWNSTPKQVTIFEFTAANTGLLTDFSSRIKGSSTSQLINNNLDCEIAE